MRQELRWVLFIVLAGVILIGTNLIFPPVRPPVTAGADSTQVADSTQTPADVTATPSLAPAAPSDSTAAPTLSTVETERSVVVEGPLYRHTFSTKGARLTSAELLPYKSFTREGPAQLLADPMHGALGLRFVVGGDTIDLRSAPFTPSRERVEVQQGEERLTFRHEEPRLTAEITYVFRPDDYLVDVTGTVTGADRPLVLTDLGRGVANNDADTVTEVRQLAWVGNHTREGVDVHYLRSVEAPALAEGPFTWLAFRSKFFVIALLPGAQGAGPEQFGGALVQPISPERVELAASELPDAQGRFGYRAYLGPYEVERLTAVEADLDEVNPYRPAIFRPFVRPLVTVISALLRFIRETFNLAHGWVLVLFGLLIRLLMWPLTTKSMRASLKSMQMQPLIKDVQARYKNNPEQMQKEMAKLMQEHGFNPFAGCLPMLLPMPILFALFFVFQYNIDFRGASFLWLPDLAAPDPYYILPIVLAASMFLLQWISVRSMTGEQAQQMKIMMWMMPIMFLFFFYKLASGLNLYYAVSNVTTIPQQWWAAKERKKVQPLAPKASPKEAPAKPPKTPPKTK